MKIVIQSPGLVLNHEPENFVREEVERFFHLYEEAIGCEVCPNLDSSSVKRNKNCRIRLLIPGNDLLAIVSWSKFEEAIDQATGKWCEFHS